VVRSGIRPDSDCWNRFSNGKACHVQRLLLVLSQESAGRVLQVQIEVQQPFAGEERLFNLTVAN
jgi:hypothetical protein